jgi:2-oxo-hept-3-ene-1,7-dioate hydratase
MPQIGGHAVLRRFIAILSLAVIASAAQAQTCGPVDHAAAIADAYLKRQPAKSPGASLAMTEAICTQARLVEILSRTLGGAIGYKVGLTSQAAQQQFGVSSPLTGVLLAKMLLPDGARVKADFAARPIFEADLLVTVRDDGINAAKTPLEAAAHLSDLIPFIELPDLVVAQGEPLTAPVIVAINVGARAGIVGTKVPMQANAEFVEALASMQVSIVDQTGAELGRAPGAAILGHPLNAVIFLAADLASRGQRLRAGDVISLGSFGRALPPKSGQTVTVRYDGVPVGPLSVSVTFE